MKYEVQLSYLASGCITECMHCSRLGHGTPPMALDDIETLFLAIKDLHQASQDFNVIEAAMFEVMTHPDPLAIFAKRAEILGDDPQGGISSSAHVIGKRADWREQLGGLKELGIKKYWLTVHGAGDVHDHYVGLPGGYALVMEAVRRIHECGLECGTNIYLNTETLETFSESMAEIQATGFDEYYVGIASFLPYERYRRYEQSRPTVEQVLEHAQTIKSMDKYPGDKWDSLETYSESGWIDEALNVTDEEDEVQWTRWFDDTQVLELIILPNLDIHDGDLSFPGNRYGNVRIDGLESALTKVLENKADGTYLPARDVRNFFRDAEPPGIAELAHQVGDRGSTRIHFHPMSMRQQWLDRLYADQRLL